MEENGKTLSTTARSIETTKEKDINPENNKESLKDEEIVDLLKKLDIDSQDLLTLVNDLIYFSFELKALKNIDLILTFDNLNILKKLSSKENIKINLILSKIYMNIMNNESLYSSYLLTIEEDKTNLLIQIIEECISLIQKLNGFVFDEELFKFKEKTLSFIKCFYYNCKSKISNEISTRKLQDLIDSFPTQYFSETNNELNKDKELYEIVKSEDQEKINNFEEKFAQINNYYEQYDAFRRFVECNSGVVTYASVGGEENPETKEEKKSEIDQNKIDFYNKYGLLILKFCKYHQYIFLNKENKEAENKEKKENEEEQENVRVVFLLDKIKQAEDEEKKEEEKKEEEKKEEEQKKEEEKKEENNEQAKKQGNKKIENLMNEKLFISVTESKEYNELIKKEINNYLKITKSLENDPKIKTIREQMSYFLSIIDIESYVPLYLTDFSKITISDNFTPSFLTNVPAGKTNELYLETRMNETMLVYIEFSQEDKSKDITFEVNKYEISSNSFKPIFKEEKIEDTFKFFILCNGYSLYQIIFNNYYSWFTSKDVNYRIALLRLIEKPKKDLNLGQNEEKEIKTEDDKIEEKKEDDKEKEKEEKKEDDKEEEKDEKVDDKFYCYFNGKNNCFNQNDINKKIKDFEEKKDENVLNIPIILYLNTLRIVSLNKDEIKIIESKEDDEQFIPKHIFDYQIIEYLKKTLKIKPAEAKNKKITLSLFSQNRDLSVLFKEVDDQIKALSVSTINNTLNDADSLNYLRKIGFYPSELLGGYKVEYKLYDLCEQSLVYYLYLSYLKKNPPKKSVLFMEFDKLVVNAAIFNEGAIYTKLKGKKENDVNWKSSYFNNINTSDVNGVLDFLENVNDTFEGIDIVLSYVDINEEQKKKLLELFDTIKKHCQEKIKPPIKVLVYEQNEIANNVFNYMNLFYDN